MAIRLLTFLLALLTLLYCALAADAATVELNWDIGWVTANPDGMQERPTIGINGQWPLPLLNITKGDRIIVNANNKLGNQSTSVHFHGMFQNGTNDMDGPVGVTQCGIPPGSSFKYNFTIDQPGTYWYHSHERGQYPDGFRGQIVVNDPENPYLGQYDEEVALSISDWYHEQMPPLLATFINLANPTGAEPVPKSALMNDTQNLTISVQPRKTYFFRLVNVAAFAGMYVWIEGHSMSIIEVDGVYTEPAEASVIYITPAQRYGFLVTMKNDASSNFAFTASMDTVLFDKIPDTLNPNVTGWLVYDQAAPLPTSTLLDSFDPFDDMALVSQDGERLLENVDHVVELNLKMDNLGDGANYAFFNNVTYVSPKVPTLYSVLTTGDMATDVAVYGSNTNAYVLNHGDVVELRLNNGDVGKHPFHLHGHTYQVIYRSEEDAGPYKQDSNTSFPLVPMRRDTFLVNPGGNFAVRFKADNPGVWLFHCHIEWHMDSGLVATMIEAPLEMQKTLSVPQDHYAACRAGNTPSSGNAAGDTVDLLNLGGENMSPAPLPAGFTARGIVALIFSCISAIVGMSFIAWYGAAPLGSSELASARKRIAQAGSGGGN